MVSKNDFDKVYLRAKRLCQKSWLFSVVFIVSGIIGLTASYVFYSLIQKSHEQDLPIGYDAIEIWLSIFSVFFLVFGTGLIVWGLLAPSMYRERFTVLEVIKNLVESRQTDSDASDSAS